MHSTRLLPCARFLAGCFFTTVTLAATPTRYAAVLFDQVDIKSDVPFRTAINEKQESEVLKLDIYRPVGDTAQNRIAVLWLHGGGFRPGNDKKQSYIVRMATEFAKRGYVSVSADYRVRAMPSDRLSVIRDAVEDGRAALAWMRAQAKELGLDPQRIAVGGGSAGGVLGTSLVALENTAAAQSGGVPVLAFVDLWGTPAAEAMLAPVDKHFAPTIIVHGTADRSVPFAHTEALVTKLKQLGVRHELVAIPDAPHTPVAHADKFVPLTAAFVLSAAR
jgi:acetyl esterase